MAKLHHFYEAPLTFLMFRRVLSASAFAAILAGCGSSQVVETRVTAAPTATPTLAATSTPAPTSTPTAAATATPTGAPPATATPVASATPQITITYSSKSVFEVALPFNNSGCMKAADFTDTFTASEPGVTSFTATSASPSQVTVAPQAASNSTFVATEPMTNTNDTATTIVVSDGNGNTANAVVQFNVQCFNGNARKR